MTPYLNNWASKWNLPPEALRELGVILGTVATVSTASTGQSENVIQQTTRLHAARNGVRLWRNNVGAAQDPTGRLIRYGLANDSKKVNKELKSSDLIGVTPYRVKPQDIGSILGIFTSYETKRGNWKYTGTEREKAQLNWIILVTMLGGFARFINDPEDIIT